MTGDQRPAALVTGASKGIGRAISERLAASGTDLVIVARERERLQRTADELAARHGVQVTAISADLGTDNGLADVVAAIADLPRLDVLVNNAHASAPAAEGPLTEGWPVWERLARVNVRAPLELGLAAVGRMRAAGGGAIVNVLSTVAFVPLVDVAAYGVTKAALWSLTSHQALAWAPDVRVNAVCPGTIGGETDPRAAAWRQLGLVPPLGRFGEPGDVAAAVCWLASAEARYVTGQVVFVDGGRVAAGGRPRPPVG